jgi:hypothetical protein
VIDRELSVVTKDALQSGTVPGAVFLGRKRPRIVGLMPDTEILTTDGPVAAGRLTAGTMIPTPQGDCRAVVAVLHVTSDPAPGDGPIQIRKGALGANLPRSEVVVAPGQRVALQDSRARHLYGADMVLAEARDLVHLDGVERLALRRRELVHVVLEGTGVVPCGDIWLESFPATEERVGDLPDYAAEQLFAAVPRLRYHSGLAAFAPDAPVLNRREVFDLTAMSTEEADSAEMSADAPIPADPVDHAGEELGYPTGLRAMIVGG